MSILLTPKMDFSQFVQWFSKGASFQERQTIETVTARDLKQLNVKKHLKNGSYARPSLVAMYENWYLVRHIGIPR